MGKIFALIFLLLAIYIGLQFMDNFDPESIKGKNVIVTGASTGIGEQLAYHYARLGANIVITARRENKLKEVVEKCKQEGSVTGKYNYIALDMANKDTAKTLIEFAEATLGGIDTLVLNHVLYHYGQWLGTPENFTQFHESMNINFHAYVRTATHAIPVLEKNKGGMVIVNSVAGRVPNPFLSTYSAAKHALEGFFGSLRDEFIMAGTDISITMCSLGFTDTENALGMIKGLGADKIIESQAGITPSKTAFAVVKAGAQKLQRLHYPYSTSKFATVAYAMFPETLSSMLRDAYIPSDKS